MMVDTDNARHYLWGDGCEGWHLLESAGLSVIRERVPPGKAERRHFHQIARQFFFILRGTATVEIDGTRHELSPGQGITVAPNSPHQFLNLGSEDVEFLVISAPPSHGDRVNLDESAAPQQA